MILLINPRTNHPKKISKDYFREPSLGLLYIAANLEAHGIAVEILDLEQYRDHDWNEIKSIINPTLKKYRLFGLTTLTNYYPYSLEIAKTIKKVNPTNTIVFGGPHVSFCYEEVLNLEYLNAKLVDFVCVGEAEISFLKLSSLLLTYFDVSFSLGKFELNLNKIKGIAYKNHNNRVIYTGDPDYTLKINQLPLPARYKLNPVNYYYSVANIIVNRGCPNQCSFCSRQKMFKHVRLRSIESILSEISDIMAIPTYTYINFYDNININKKFFSKFCRMFVDNKINIHWGCEIRVDNLSLNEAKLLKLAGCRLVATGIESASREVLRNNFKYQDPEDVYRGLLNLRECGIPVQAYFVLGLPGETERSFCQTIQYIKKLKFNLNDRINYFVATPYPGSKLWEKKDEFSLTFVDNDYTHYDCDRVIFETKILKFDQLRRMARFSKKIERYLNSREDLTE